MVLFDEIGVEIIELFFKFGVDLNIRDCVFGWEENGRILVYIVFLREDND